MPITPPPTGLNAYAKRVSPTVPTGFVLDDFGNPDPDLAVTNVVEDWGRIQVTFGSTDVTFLRDVPCEVVSYSTAEPFGDETAVLKFPQISPFDTLGTGDLAAFVDWADVTLNRVYFDTGTNQEVVDPNWSWCGLWVSQDIERDGDDGGTTFHCVGVLYEADFRVAVPSLDPVSETDIAGLIFARLDDPTFRFTAPVIPEDIPDPGDFGFEMTSPDLGAYQQLLTGLIQDYLALSYEPASGVQWTVTNDERDCVIQLKDTTTVDWTISAAAPGVNLRLSRDLSMMPKAIYGSGQAPFDGCDWRHAFYPGLVSGDLFGHLIRPLYVESEYEPNLYDAVGEVTGPNPSYDPDLIRVERFEAFGRIERATAVLSAQAEVIRDGEMAGPSWTGTLTLTIDPQQGSRWGIRAGSNVQMMDVRAFNPVLHIARAEANLASDPPTMTLTVDTKSRDLPTLGAVDMRERDNFDLVRRRKPTRNTSRLFNDRVVPVDCESGGGVIPSTAVATLGWTVRRIAFGTRGDIAKVDVQASSAVEIAVGLFNRPILAAELLAAGSPADDDYWDYDNWDENSGLIQAWGQGEDLGGYGQYSAADEVGGVPAPLTGRLYSEAGAPYESTQPPWLWVAMWATGAVNISGTLFPGPQGTT